MSNHPKNSSLQHHYNTNHTSDENVENINYNKGKNNVGMQSQENINSWQSSMGFVF